MPSGRVTAAQAAARSIRDAPASSRASCMVWGRPRPMPMGTRLTNRESSRASGVTAISLMGKDRPWVIATTFSLIATTSPGSRAMPVLRAVSSAAPTAAARSSWLRTSPARSGRRAQVSPRRRMIRCRPGLGRAAATRSCAPTATAAAPSP